MSQCLADLTTGVSRTSNTSFNLSFLPSLVREEVRDGERREVLAGERERLRRREGERERERERPDTCRNAVWFCTEQDRENQYTFFLDPDIRS